MARPATATPLAITDNLNFGNPEKPEIMGQFVGCIEGIGAACKALDMPIVSGNVSLYNESKATGGGSAILPTPAIGGVGLLAIIGGLVVGFLAGSPLQVSGPAAGLAVRGADRL